ncbi:unnamed protein product [Amoebophrya sp. A25]|nr:unnamed protein product [Amoebophrya sp. A25]|eukprot:GSA25T00024808001.1
MVVSNSLVRSLLGTLRVRVASSRLERFNTATSRSWESGSLPGVTTAALPEKKSLPLGSLLLSAATTAGRTASVGSLVLGRWALHCAAASAGVCGILLGAAYFRDVHEDEDGEHFASTGIQRPSSSDAGWRLLNGKLELFLEDIAGQN